MFINLMKSTLYPGVGHGGIFQYDENFVPKALDFLSN